MPVPTDPALFPAEAWDDFERVTLARAAQFPELRCLGGRTRKDLLNRWATRGVRGILLESEMIGGRRFVWRAGVRKFLAAIEPGKAQSRWSTADARKQWIRERLAEAGI